MPVKRLLRRVGQALRLLVFAAVTVILVANIYIAAAKGLFGQSSPTFFGFSDSVVLTGSMSGAIEPNDVIITRAQKAYHVGDIITFRTGSSSVTHRIIAIDEEGYRTKGDANNTADELPVGHGAVVGKVILVIPGLGAVFRFVKTPIGMLAFFVLAAVIIELPDILKHTKKRKTA